MPAFPWQRFTFFTAGKYDLKMGSTVRKPDFTTLMEWIAAMVTSVPSPSGHESQTLHGGDEEEFASDAGKAILSEKEVKLLKCSALYAKCLREKPSAKLVDAIERMVRHICWEDEALSLSLVSSLGKKLYITAASKMKPFLLLIGSTLSIRDPCR